MTPSAAPPRSESLAESLEMLRSSSQATDSIEDVWRSIWVLFQHFHAIVEALVVSQDAKHVNRCLTADDSTPVSAVFYNWPSEEKGLGPHVLRGRGLHLPSWADFAFSVNQLHQQVVGEEAPLPGSIDDRTHRHGLDYQTSIPASASTMSHTMSQGPPRFPPGGAVVVGKLQQLLCNDQLQEFLKEKRTPLNEPSDPFDIDLCPDCPKILPPPPVCLDTIRRLEGCRRIDRETFELQLADAEKQKSALKGKLDGRVASLEDRISKLQFERKSEARRRQEQRAEINAYRRKIRELESALAEEDSEPEQPPVQILGARLGKLRTGRVSPALSCVNEESECSSMGTPEVGTADHSRHHSFAQSPILSPPIFSNCELMRSGNDHNPPVSEGDVRADPGLVHDLLEAQRMGKELLTEYQFIAKHLYRRVEMMAKALSHREEELKDRSSEVRKLKRQSRRLKVATQDVVNFQMEHSDASPIAAKHRGEGVRFFGDGGSPLSQKNVQKNVFPELEVLQKYSRPDSGDSNQN